MKQIITKLALAALAFGTPGCSDDDSPGPNRGGASESQELTLTPIGQLNQGADEINSHADATARSSVKMNYRSYLNLGQSVTGNDNPNYARIKKLSDGSYILFNHYGGQGNANGFDVYYATSPDLENWTGRGLFLERYVITNSRGNQDKRVFTNPNAIVLSNGDLLAFASYRANMSYNYLDWPVRPRNRHPAQHGQRQDVERSAGDIPRSELGGAHGRNALGRASMLFFGEPSVDFGRSFGDLDGRLHRPRRDLDPGPRPDPLPGHPPALGEQRQGRHLLHRPDAGRRAPQQQQQAGRGAGVGRELRQRQHLLRHLVRLFRRQGAMGPSRRGRNGTRRPSEQPVQRRGALPRAVPVGRDPRILRTLEPDEHAPRRRPKPARSANRSRRCRDAVPGAAWS